MYTFTEPFAEAEHAYRRDRASEALTRAALRRELRHRRRNERQHERSRHELQIRRAVAGKAAVSR